MWMTKQQVDTQTCEEIASYGCQPGTSFAAPCVAGVVALMLEANPGLSWRDVQEAIVRTAATIDDDPNDPDDWQTNTAGLDHSYEYGHGLVDAYEAVSFVTGTNGYPAWTPLAAESVMTLDVAPKGVQVGPGQTRTILLQGDGGLRVEHVELTMDVTATGAPGIGPLEIEVERLQLQQGDSPQPQVTRSVFAVARDDTSPSYDDGVFTSVRHWGEQSNATWKVRFRNTSTAQNPVTATWNNAELRLYGTE